MPYIERDANNQIVAIYKANPNKESVHRLEEMDATMHEVLSFLLPETWAVDTAKFLQQTDLSMVRVVEDLVTVLIDKNVLAFTDLPEAAVTKILLRRRLREKMAEIGSIVT